MSARHGDDPGTAPLLRITTREQSVPVQVCRLEGEADHDVRPMLDKALGEAIAARPALLVVDLAPLTFSDSSCLNALVQARLDAEAAGVWLVLAAPGPQMRRLLEITGTDQVFTIRSSVRAVLGAGPSSFTGHE